MPSTTFALAPLSHLELTPPDMVLCAALAGYQALGLRLIPATATETRHDAIGNTPTVREIARRLDDTGMQLLDIELFSLRPDTQVADYRAALETGVRLGARHALVSGQDPDPARLSQNFGQFAEMASSLGLRACLEPVPWVAISSLAKAEALIQQSGAQEAGIVIDALHFDRAGETPATLAAIAPSRFPYVQLCDAPAERPADLDGLLFQARRERLMPGDGGLNLSSLLAGLPGNIPIGLEVPLAGLSLTVAPVERAKRMRLKTEALLQGLAA
ncbi:sugar phosphate isomerase/epimerase family protein [Kerstersia sp.]|uniref:sugar phosphate isomerase/epimerase family protein n=1 Tax=Kerstersia sp. TaxID=1930783 RepID=UPI003F8FD0A0